MPRRGGFGGGGGSRSRPSSPGRAYNPPSGPRGYSTMPKSAPPPASASKAPSAMKQMATTAGGVAAGMVLGHAVISALSPRERIPYYNDTYNRASTQDLQNDPCGEMLKNLISCMRMAQEVGTDVTNVCSQAEKGYLECRQRNGDPDY